MPFTSLQHPSLGPALLAEHARRTGIPTVEKFFGFDFAEAIGLDAYQMLSDPRLYHAQIGEWIFSGLVHPRPESASIEYVSSILTEHVDGVEWLAVVQEAIAARKRVARFIEDSAGEVAAEQPTVVGLSSSFQQVMSSIAIARAIRARLPDAILVMGGANCEGPLGPALLDAYPELDAVCIGEGDEAFPEFLAAATDRHDLPDIGGMVNRRQRETSADPTPARVVSDLDALPVPRFSAFFDRFAASPGLSDRMTPAATIETSRGCWWGAKHHCTFCGLNGQTMQYRSKSPARAFAEFCELADRHGPDLVVVDNILDHRYLQSLVPMLRDDDRDFLMHYEVKANLSASAIALLAAAGVRKIQPGIESFDTDILRLMRKGVSAIQNIQTLKLCAEAGIFVDWCFLYGFPGEDPGAYDRMAALIRQLHHLQPPGSVSPVRADRFSPYFEQPDAFGIRVAPARAYGFIYDVPSEDLPRFAYHFDIIDEGPIAASDRARPTIGALRVWQDRSESAQLHVEGDRLTDTRGEGDGLSLQLTPVELRILTRCATIQGRDALEDDMARDFGPSEVRDGIERLRALGVVFEERNSMLSLALRKPGYDRAPSWSQIRSGPAQAFATSHPSLFAS